MKKTYLFFTQTLMIFSLFFAVSCNKTDNEEKSGKKLEVGQSYQGGIIAYIDESGEHGLIAASEDQGVAKWCKKPFSFIDSLGTDIGTGKNNTKRIVQKQDTGHYAAKLCYDLVRNGFNDWYLPSKVELQVLYKNRNAIGGFDFSKFYWSSSEYSNDDAWYQNFNNGSQNGNYKDRIYCIRAVRTF